MYQHGLVVYGLFVIDIDVQANLEMYLIEPILKPQ